MKKIVLLFFTLFSFVLYSNCSTFASETTSPLIQNSIIQIPGNSKVSIVNISEINSSKVKIGDFIDFKVKGDLIIKNQVVIKAESSAIGEITGLDIQKEFGGKILVLSFRILNIKVDESQTIPVIGNFSVQGEKNKAFALPGGPLFAKVKNVVIPAGTEYSVLIAEDTTVKIK